MTTENDQPPTVPVPDELPPALAANGPFATRFVRYKPPAGLESKYQQEWESATSAFNRFRSGYEKAKTGSSDPESTFRAVLESLGQAQYQVPASRPVMAYSLAISLNLATVADELWEKARQEYLSDFTRYNQIFGALLPEPLRQLGRWMIYHAGTNPTALADWDIFLDSLTAGSADTAGRIETGLTPLDDALLNGLDGLTVLGGPTGGGKSVLAQNLVTGALRRHLKLAVLYVLLDPGMTRLRLYQRIACAAASIDYRALISNPTTETLQKVRAASEGLKTDVLTRFRVLEVPALRFEPFDEDSIMTGVKELRAATGAERVLIVVDDLEHLDVPEELRKAQASLEADFARIDVIQQVRSHTSSYAHPAGAPVLLLSGITKAWDGKSPLTADFLPGSVRLKQAADTVLMLQPGGPPNDAAAPAPVSLRIVKGRDGARRVDLALIFDHTHCLFRPGPALPTRRGTAAGSAPALDPLAGVGEG